ncbi:EscU/YscU/HrcU family type III secretion system export apparatus switch protein [Limnoglobus roseus]|uniref:Flagellar biosynthesis protein FlhB n=1 Tax=Limnoglobus roseus TaxID=2598579 RepID=A0A5C1A873_9BACT|nr:EscU/YscU/HrcU family type III secretion system export apparatus switch protein [Limnoglobus roseus]QEL13334.1 flagellar biosynthesis protein FlhB [Limnoglobus roseus]
MAEPGRKRAVALKYDPKEAGAPKIVAKATGATADRMLAIARQNGVPVREDKALVTVLSKLNIDQEIPPQLYRAVAAILAFLYKANQKPG